MSKDPTKFVGGSAAPDGSSDDVVMMDHTAACVVVLNGKRRGAEFALIEGSYTIGRDDTVKIWIHDTAMSRRHAAVVVENGKYVLRDLDSTNGVNLEGNLIKGSERELEDGNRFTVGKTEFQFLLPGSRVSQRVEVGKRPSPEPSPGPNLSGTRGELFGSMDDLPPEDITTGSIETLDGEE